MKKLEEIKRLHQRIVARSKSPFLTAIRAEHLQAWKDALSWVMGEGELPIELREKKRR